jgi:hypothetical protein
MYTQTQTHTHTHTHIYIYIIKYLLYENNLCNKKVLHSMHMQETKLPQGNKNIR